jgi:hypothetical protein
MQLQLKRFDVTSIADDQVIVLIGKRDTGKSFLVRDVLYYHQDIPIGTVISATESANCFYGNIIPSLFIHEECSPDIIENVVKRQKLVISKKKSEINKYNDSSIDPRGFLILDDCLYDSTWTKDKNIRSLFMNGRHFKILFIITMQYPLGIPPNLRTNIDYVFILRENLVNNRKRIYENYAGMFPNFETFCQIMDQCTENYECLVIHNNAKSNKIEDQVFWYKADTHGDFKLGGPEYWLTHNNNFDEEEEEDEDIFDLTKLRKKRGPIVNVKKL